MVDTILLIGEQPILAAELRRMLAEAETVYPVGKPYRVEVVASPTAVVPSLARRVALVLLPLLQAPDNISQRITAVRKCGLSSPILLLTAATHEPAAIAALSAGADDYLVRERLNPELLARTIAHLTIRAEESSSSSTRVGQQARSFQEAQRQLAELSALHAIALAGATVDSEDALISEFTYIVGETLYPDNFGILLLAESGQHLVPHQSYHLDESINYDSFVSLQDSLCGEVVRRGEPILLSDVGRATFYREIDPQTRSELCVPLKVNDKIIGVINTESQERDAFTAEDLRLLTTLAGQLATAIERIRLMERERRQRREAEMLREATMALSVSLDLEQVMQTILAHLRQVIPYDSSTVMLCRDGYLRVVAKSGLSGPEAKLLLDARFSIEDDHLFITISETKRPLRLKDAQADARFQGWGGTHTTRSWLGVPLLARGEVFGLLTLDRLEVDVYDAHQMELAQMFANQAAIAIENARLFQTTQQNAAELQIAADILHHLNASPDVTVVFPHVAEKLRSLTGCSRVTILLLGSDDDTGYFFALDRVRTVFRESVPLRLTETAATPDVRAGRPHLTPDLGAEQEKPVDARLYQEGIRSRINLPLIVEERVTGSLNLGWTKTAAYDPDKLPSLQQIASALALAIERGRLYDESHRRAGHLTVINEMGQQMTGLLSVEELCHLVAQQLHDSFSYTNVAVLLREPTGGDQLLLQALVGPETAALQSQIYRQQIGKGIVGQVALSGEAVLVNDVTQHPDFIPSYTVAIASELVVPLQAGKQVIGVLKVDHSAQNAFDQEDLATLTTIGDQLAVAVEKARLFEETRRRTAELETLITVSATLRAATSMDEVLWAAVSQVRQVIASSQAAIFLLEESSQLLVSRCVDPPRDIIWRFPSGTGIVGQALTSREIYVTADLGQDPLAQMVESGDTAVSPRGGVTLPLQTGDRVIGIIQIILALEMEPTAAQLRLLTGIAEIVGSALDRALVLETLEQRVASRTHELRVANEQLQQLDQLKSKFVSDVSHELRTPITNLNLYLDLLAKGEVERRPHYLQVLQQQTKRLTNLLEDILSLSRLEMGQYNTQLGPVDLNQILAPVIMAHQPRARMDGLAIRVDLQPGLPPVWGERNQLAQVMTNLLTNAISYTPQGTITVRTHWQKEDARICLEVSDTGLGIPETDRPYLFDRFYRGQQAGQSTIPGTGLGLAIVKEIVDLHQGEIVIESEVDKGTVFGIYLPTATELEETTRPGYINE